MSVFGLLSMLFFLILTGGLVMLYFNHNEDIGMARVMMLMLYLLLTAEFFLAVAEFPLYVVDGIIFACMGVENLADVMLLLYAGIVAFILIMTLPRIKWKKFLTATPAKLIVTGVLIIGCLMYTELFNGKYSFDDPSEYSVVREMYSEYDNHFFPTKFIETYDDETQERRISVYPFDAVSAAGQLDFIYRGEISFAVDESGATQIFFYPFTYKAYEGSDPVNFLDPTYIPASRIPEPVVSGADVSGADVSAADAVQ